MIFLGVFLIINNEFEKFREVEEQEERFGY